MNSVINRAAENFQDWPDATLTMLIIGVALVYIVLALTIHNRVIKAVILAYAILP
jgi:hypothetical protein